MIRDATVRDVPAFADIINDCAEFGQMLHRSHEYLYEHVRDFRVAVDGDAVVGVCGLRVVWSNLAEVYALAVSAGQRGTGLGRRLVESCVEDARSLGICRLMALTYERGFFERIGFTFVDRHDLPLKVWSECVRCLKNQSCDEVAVVLRLDDVPDIGPAAPERLPMERYVVPVTTSIGRGRSEGKMDEGE